MPDGRCPQCMAAAGAVCSACDTTNLRAARFCINCGKALHPGPIGAQGVSAERLGVERRHVTVVFCDLVASSALANSMDAEDYATVIRSFHQSVTRVVEAAGGFLARYMGDGALIYFGYPQAAEDDTERAVRAALDVVAIVGTLQTTDGRRLQTHIGISAGEVVVGDIVGIGGPRVLDMAGETPNLAARLEGIAEPGTVVVDARVMRLIGGLFECRSIGRRELKGWATAVHVWQVLRPVPLVDRFEARTYVSRSPLIGRSAELDLLRTLWRCTCDGQGKTVVISGEPGIGKSRLTADLLEHVAGGMNATTQRYYCNPQQKGVVLAPCIQALEFGAGFTADDSPDQRMDKLRATLPDATPRDLRLIADLLMLPASPAEVLQISPQLRRAQTIEALIGAVQALSRRHPVLVLFEDTHWADPTTVELLGIATRDIDRYPILALITARPEFNPPWEAHANVETIILDPMSDVESRQLVSWVAGDHPLRRSVVQDIIKRSDGVPLFIEEVTRAVIEVPETGGRGGAGPTAMPLTIHGSLLARLDQLGPAREVAKIAAVIGRDFSIELLASVTGQAESELRPVVRQLLKSGLVLPSAPDHRRFRFKHMLIQDAAYGSIVRSERIGLHARIANALEADFPNLATGEPQLLAHHCAEAGFLEKSINWWLHAGIQLLMRSATQEALELLARAIELNAGLPDCTAKMHRELELSIAYAKALIATQGHAAPSTGAVFARARELCEALGNPPHFLTVLHGQWTNALFRADLLSADSQAREILRLSEGRSDPGWSLIGCYSVGITALPLGNFQDVVTYLGRGLRAASERGSAYAGPVVPDPVIVMRTYFSWALVNLGRFAVARREARRAVADARKLGQAFTLAYALVHNGLTTLMTASPRDGLSTLQELQDLAVRHGIAFHEAVARVLRGWGIAMQGEPEHGLALIREGTDLYRQTGNMLYVASYMRLEAEALCRAGRPDEGLTILAEADPLRAAQSSLFDDAEFERARAELLWLRGDTELAERAFRLAIRLAERRSASFYALRAALPLAQMLATQRRSTEAAEVLAPICVRLRGCGQATELTEARAMLRTLRLNSMAA
jgi:class 3 adenylate cyclase/tetratricopeptide (TPR) repeat protein